MRIAHVVPTRDPSFGGPVQVAEALESSLKSSGHDIVVAPSMSGRKFFYWPGLAGIRELTKAVLKSDIVHIHGLWTMPTTIAAYAALAYGRPYIVSAHGMMDRWSLQRSRLKKRVYALLLEQRALHSAAAVHFGTRDEANEATGFGVLRNVVVVPNAVQAEYFYTLPSRERLNQRFPQLVGKIVGLFLGRVHPKKGLELLVSALRLARQENPLLHILIVGPDELGHRTALERTIRDYGLLDAVDFVGPVYGAGKLSFFGGADFFVLPSYQEGDSVAIKEALAAGLPVVASEACRCLDVVSYGAGVMVPLEVAAWASEMVKIARDAKARKSMGNRAKSLARSVYSWEVFVNRFIGVYHDVLNNTRLSNCWYEPIATSTDRPFKN
jgi:glycosyltransferase involved in cell wall biosynthesis